jgi:hypothetical protein
VGCKQQHLHLQATLPQSLVVGLLLCLLVLPKVPCMVRQSLAGLQEG